MSEIERTGRTVVGLFRSRAFAEAAIRDLQSAGFPDDRIGVALQEAGTNATAGDSGALAVDGAAKGAVSGGVVGGLIGLLGSLLVPGIGPVVAGGVLASLLTGAGIGAATGGVIGGLMGLGVPEGDARHFDLGLRSGGTLVTVDAGARTGEALTILQRHEVDLGPGGADRYGPLDWSARDTSTPGATPAAEAAADLDAISSVTDLEITQTGFATPGLGDEDVAAGSTAGNRGAPSRRGYVGRERRQVRDPSYTGPERRLIGV